MHTQTIQQLRGEVEAVATLQMAFNRLGLRADENALSVWDGPRPDEVADTADEDGGFSHMAIRELRTRAASALGARYREVVAAIDRLGNRDEDMHLHLRQVLGSTLVAGTGGLNILKSPNPGAQLETLVKSGELRLDYAHNAVRVVRQALDESTQVEVPAAPVKVAAAKKPAAKKAAAKKPAKAAKKPAKKAAPKKARKPAKKAAPKKAAKKPAKKAAARKPAKKSRK